MMRKYDNIAYFRPIIRIGMPKYKDCNGFITALGSSVPAFRFSQREIGDFLKRYMTLDEKGGRLADRLVKQTKIDFRYSAIPDYGRKPSDFEFYPRNETLEPFPGVGQRMHYYRVHARPLAAAAALRCLENASAGAADITHLIVVSCTGMYAPGLDIDIVRTLGMRHTVTRTCVNFMGCYAAFHALKIAASTMAADPSARVLIVCVELCSLHFQKDGPAGSNLLTNMLFGDGASAALVEGEKKGNAAALRLLDFASDIFPEGGEDMTWEIADAGFAMKLTGRVPEILKTGVKRVFDRLLAKEEYMMKKVDHYVFHPGGPRVLEVLEKVLDIGEHDNMLAYQVLKEYGNMSSATLFFILQRLVESGDLKDGDLVLSAAFGPGLTCESALMSVAV